MGDLGDKLRGKARELGGEIKEGLGAATGDRDLQADGAGDRAEGETEQAIGEAKDTWQGVRDTGGAAGSTP